MYCRIALSLSLFASAHSLAAAPLPGAAQAAAATIAQADMRSGIRPLPGNDAATLAQAFRAIAAKDWGQARLLARSMNDAAAKELVVWRLLSARESDATFAEYDRFLRLRPRWPGGARLRMRAEEAMAKAALSNQAVIQWFANDAPATPAGMIRLGEVLLATGKREEAVAWIRRGWVAGDFPTRKAQEIHRRHAALLRGQDHVARANRLAWRGAGEPVRFMRQFLNAGTVAVIDVRRKLQRSTRDAQKAYDRLSGAQRQDPGLMFDRARWLRKRGQNEAARPLLSAAAKALAGQPPDTDAWWKEIQYQAREALDAGQNLQAYDLAANHRLHPSAGEPFAAAEFLAGWTALRFVAKPDAAQRHFARLASAASVPTSLARASYWLGRTAEALHKNAEAQAHYKRAAVHALTYYGQLARAKVGLKGQTIAADAPVAPAVRQAFETREEIRALRLLIAMNETSLARTFALGLPDRFSTRDEFALLAEIMRRSDAPGTAVRIARRGVHRNLVAVRAAYPSIALPPAPGAKVAPALVLGLVRQESEFNPGATSRAGARGLMQLMPGTARFTAKAHGVKLKHVRELLTPQTNLTIGQAHLSDLLQEFAGSYVLSIGSYNAGKHRIRKWIERYGDPRNRRVDTVDWVERIPFTETRGYVQRVLENVAVYRAIAGEQPGSLLADLERGAFGPALPRIEMPAPVPADTTSG